MWTEHNYSHKMCAYVCVYARVKPSDAKSAMSLINVQRGALANTVKQLVFSFPTVNVNI
jgi:hypothetical protein